MQKNIFGFIVCAIIVTIYMTALSTKANASQEGSSERPISTQVDVTNRSLPVNNDPRMRRDYQRWTPGPGRGAPVYPNAYSSSPANSPYTRDAVQPDQRFGRPGYGRGYGYGYPGYRGHGGSGYPRHRQYGNPPRYPAVTVPGEQLIPQQ